jgi:hypothetical protein
MQKRLTLVHPDEVTDQREFIPGKEGVSGIVRVDGGYAVDRGAARIVFPDHRVSSYYEERKPGIATEPEDPSRLGKRDDEDGQWRCSRCAKKYASFHALKTHHGRSHG